MFNMTDSDSPSPTTMVNVMKEFEPLDRPARIFYHRRMVEIMEKKKLLNDELAAIKEVVLEDDAKYIFFPDKDGDTASPHYQLVSFSLIRLQPDEVTSLPRIDYGSDLVRPGTLVKITTGSYKGEVGLVETMWSKTAKPRGATCWNIRLLKSDKIIRRQEKTLHLTDN
jgi:hypothetical protein